MWQIFATEIALREHRELRFCGSDFILLGA
jgi:hypothetical protein